MRINNKCWKFFNYYDKTSNSYCYISNYFNELNKTERAYILVGKDLDLYFSKLKHFRKYKGVYDF